MSPQFVDGWTIAQILGEGAFGEVKLLVNDDTREAVAVKTINLQQHPDAKLAVRKEVAIHKFLNHDNIVRYFGHRSEPGLEYIFLEYAAGGELFDKIEPDFGMKSKDAQKYLVQLISAVRYLHERGVTHRDIKPENILLSECDEVKLSDFGMATMFRKNGVERRLDKRCGTMPYVAPEVLVAPYNAAPADMWSCGIVLVALLAGELPWDIPAPECLEFASWTDNVITISPWNKLDNIVLNLLRKMLAPDPKKRITPDEVLAHKWCVTLELIDSVRHLSNNTTMAKRQHSDMERFVPDVDSQERACATQPLLQRREKSQSLKESPENFFCFSQPVLLDDMLLSSQLHATQATANVFQKHVRRMTRLFVRVDHETAFNRLSTFLEALGCTCRRGPSSVLTSAITDRRKMQLVFKVNFIDMNESLLMDFRLSKGDGLEFKKLFLKAKNALSDIVNKPVLWPVV